METVDRRTATSPCSLCRNVYRSLHRRKLDIGFLAGLASFLASTALAQWQSRDVGVLSPQVKLSINALSGGAYWVEGRVSNGGFVIGDEGVIAIDAQYFAITAMNELEEIARIPARPVNDIIITHSDSDHINGPPAFTAGTEVIAEETPKTEMIQALADPNPNFTKPPIELKHYFPTHTVGSGEDLVFDGIRVVLICTASVHTEGDVVIFLPTRKVVFAGDLLTSATGPYPGIHLEKHGSSPGWIESK